MSTELHVLDTLLGSRFGWRLRDGESDCSRLLRLIRRYQHKRSWYDPGKRWLEAIPRPPQVVETGNQYARTWGSGKLRE